MLVLWASCALPVPYLLQPVALTEVRGQAEVLPVPLTLSSG